MMTLKLTVTVPSTTLEERQTIAREIGRNVVNGQGLIITMPDGYTFSAILDEVG